jgi:hypothetical protein
MCSARMRCAVLLALSLLAAASQAATCRAGFGDVVTFEGCDTIVLRELRLRFVDVTTPNPDVPLSCWNYTAALADGSAETTFRQCHTGALGGHTSFEVAGETYTVLFDLSAGCVPHPNGHWIPARRGHVFYAGELSAERRERLQVKNADAESKCHARPRHAASPQGSARARS